MTEKSQRLFTLANDGCIDNDITPREGVRLRHNDVENPFTDPCHGAYILDFMRQCLRAEVSQDTAIPDLYAQLKEQLPPSGQLRQFGGMTFWVPDRPDAYREEHQHYQLQRMLEKLWEIAQAYEQDERPGDILIFRQRTRSIMEFAVANPSHND